MRRTNFFLLLVLSTLMLGLEPITLRIGDTSALLTTGNTLTLF